jgi:hypothetical protein
MFQVGDTVESVHKNIRDVFHPFRVVAELGFGRVRVSYRNRHLDHTGVIDFNESEIRLVDYNYSGRIRACIQRYKERT